MPRLLSNSHLQMAVNNIAAADGMWTSPEDALPCLNRAIALLQQCKVALTNPHRQHGMSRTEAQRIAREIADSLIKEARTLEEPVVMVGNNNAYPALRSIGEAEKVWQADDCLWSGFDEQVEQFLYEEDVHLGTTPDCSLYVTDLRRWRSRESTVGATLTDDWERISS